MTFYRPTFADTVLCGDHPKWVCNLSTDHFPDGVIVNGDSVDKKTIVLSCMCVECLNFNISEYEISWPILLSDSFSVEYMREHYVGIYARR